ncbi:MAG: hypothetical protein PGN07_00460 [Aeromicrobium erythreum]
MVVGRHGQTRLGPRAVRVEQVRQAALAQGEGGVRVELLGPVPRGGAGLPPGPTQGVHDVAAADEQDPTPAQAAQAGEQRVQVGQSHRLVEADLQDGHLGLGREEPQDRPRAVVEAPLGVEAGLVLEQLALEHPRHGRVPLGRVLDPVQLVGEATEVVDDGVAGRIGDVRAALRHPVRADHDDRLRVGQPSPLGGPRARVVVVADGVHRVAVADEEHRHPVAGAQPRLEVGEVVAGRARVHRVTTR